jgi:hypothetical protein
MVDGRENTAGSARSRRVHEFPANAHVRAHAITADFRSTLIRNQQVRGSRPIAGSKIPRSFPDTKAWT